MHFMVLGAGPDVMRRWSAHLKNLEGRHSSEGEHELTVSQRDEGSLGGLIKKKKD